ncbi:MAG: hypothetical protein APF76_11760 [Desulfitibacter sp. BRH_c19]|nr:MAG: hypothetical protein APF76_11760 [Desulfitibacter sp. BRH_c19]
MEKGVINLKKMWVLLMVLLMILSLVACSAENAEQPGDSQYEDVSDYENNDENDKENSIDDIEDEQSGNAAEIGKANTGLINEDKIPSGYRKDVAPIVGGSEIYDGQVLEQNGNTYYWIMCYSKAEKEDILKFYKEVLENATDKEEGTLSTGSYYLNGTLDNVRISLTIGDEDVHEEYKSFFPITMEMLE